VRLVCLLALAMLALVLARSHAQTRAGRDDFRQLVDWVQTTGRSSELPAEIVSSVAMGGEELPMHSRTYQIGTGVMAVGRAFNIVDDGKRRHVIVVLRTTDRQLFWRCDIDGNILLTSTHDGTTTTIVMGQSEKRLFNETIDFFRAQENK
jgi:hypothetical protein